MFERAIDCNVFNGLLTTIKAVIKEAAREQKRKQKQETVEKNSHSDQNVIFCDSIKHQIFWIGFEQFVIRHDLYEY